VIFICIILEQSLASNVPPQFEGTPELKQSKSGMKGFMSRKKKRNNQKRDHHRQEEQTHYLGEFTDSGFVVGPLEVFIVGAHEKYGVIIQLKTDLESLEIRSTPSGRLIVSAISKKRLKKKIILN